MLQVAMLNSLIVFLFAYFLELIEIFRYGFLVGLFAYSPTVPLKGDFFFFLFLFFFCFMLLLLFVPCFIEFVEGGAYSASTGNFKRIRGLSVVVEHYGNQWAIVSLESREGPTIVLTSLSEVSIIGRWFIL